MIHAYDKLYLEKARVLLGRMLDFAVYDLKLEIAEFYNAFLTSGYAKKFEAGEALLLSGKSGVELAYDITGSCAVKPRFTMGRSSEYWTGWALAYYQWYTALSFREINEIAPIEEVVRMYPKYHEMDIRQFVSALNEIYIARNPQTKLKRKRLETGLSQSDLAIVSGVSVRTIQQYEQRQKNINCAKVEAVMAIAQALSCDIKEVLEPIDGEENCTFLCP